MFVVFQRIHTILYLAFVAYGTIVIETNYQILTIFDTENTYFNGGYFGPCFYYVLLTFWLSGLAEVVMTSNVIWNGFLEINQ